MTRIKFVDEFETMIQKVAEPKHVRLVARPHWPIRVYDTESGALLVSVPTIADAFELYGDRVVRPDVRCSYCRRPADALSPRGARPICRVCHDTSAA